MSLDSDLGLAGPADAGFVLGHVAPRRARYQLTISASVVAVLSFGILVVALAIHPGGSSPAHPHVSVLSIDPASAPAFGDARG